MNKKHFCKILCVLVVALSLSFGSSTILVFGDHFCEECATTYVICPCPAKRAEQQLIEATGPVEAPFVWAMPLSTFSCPFLWGPCPVELKTRMNN